MVIEELKKKIQLLISESRFNHSLRVSEAAVKLAERYSIDIKKAEIASLIHDSAKELSPVGVKKNYQFSKLFLEIYDTHPQIWHSFIVKEFASIQFGITDDDILEAAKWHTTGKENMSMLEKIVFVSDFIEPQRQFDKRAEVEKIALVDIDQATALVASISIQQVLMKKEKVFDKTVECYNYYCSSL